MDPILGTVLVATMGFVGTVIAAYFIYKTNAENLRAQLDHQESIRHDDLKRTHYETINRTSQIIAAGVRLDVQKNLDSERFEFNTSVNALQLLSNNEVQTIVRKLVNSVRSTMDEYYTGGTGLASNNPNLRSLVQNYEEARRIFRIDLRVSE